MLCSTELRTIFDTKFSIYTLSEDAVSYTEYCLKFISSKSYQEIKTVCQKIDSYHSSNMDEFMLLLTNDLFETSITFRDYRHDNVVSAYDIIIGICFTDTLYEFFKDLIPVFPYQTDRVFNYAIELSFGEPDQLPQEFVIPLINYLRSSLAIAQHKVDFEQTVNQKSSIKYKAPLNLAGEYCTCICEEVLDKFVSKYGAHWMEHLNMINLINVLQTG